MLTRNQRRTLSERGIVCEFLVYDSKPKSKVKLKKKFNGNSPQCVEITSLCSDEDRKLEENNYGVKCRSVVVGSCEDNETGLSSMPDTTTNDLDLLNNKLFTNGIHSQTCYCDSIVLPSDEHVAPSKPVWNEGVPKSWRTSPRQNVKVEKEATCFPIADVRSSHYVTTSNRPNQLIRSKPKIEILEILCLPPGMIDPKCPIDIIERPLDLSMKRSSTEDLDSQPIDLSTHKNHHTPYQIQPYDTDDDEVIILDASYTMFDTPSTSSEQTESLDKQEDLCHPEVEPPPMEQSELLSIDKDMLRVYELLNLPCFQFFGYGVCTRDPCYFRHELVEVVDLQEILESESITIIEKCYTVVQQFDSLYIKYFKLFCIIFGRKQMIDTLVRMIRDCERPKRPVSYYRHIIAGLKLSKLDNVASYNCLIQNCTVTSPKLFNILIWIMVDLDVVLEFRDQLSRLLKHDGFYVSAPNLTRLLGVCSRTKDCALIRIIYEVVENYPDKVKSQLHWGVRPQFIRMESETTDG